MIRLPHRVSLTVPSTTDGSTPISAAALDARSANVAREFSARFGGATVTDAAGFYVADDGRLIAEQVRLVTSYAEDIAPPDGAWLEERARSWCALWSQETVALTVDGTMILLD